jgi:hypothetical protein
MFFSNPLLTANLWCVGAKLTAAEVQKANLNNIYLAVMGTDFAANGGVITLGNNGGEIDFSVWNSAAGATSWNTASTANGGSINLSTPFSAFACNQAGLLTSYFNGATTKNGNNTSATLSGSQNAQPSLVHVGQISGIHAPFGWITDFCVADSLAGCTK